MSHNKYFDDAWAYLAEKHPFINLQGDALDFSVKPHITKKEQCHYMNAVYNLLVIGTRENLITPHLNGKGCIAYIKLRD